MAANNQDIEMVFPIISIDTTHNDDDDVDQLDLQHKHDIKEEEDDTHNASSDEEDMIIAKRRRICLLVAIVPFLMSAIALLTVLRLNNSSNIASSSNSALESTASLRGSSSDHQDSSFIETYYLNASHVINETASASFPHEESVNQDFVINDDAYEYEYQHEEIVNQDVYDLYTTTTTMATTTHEESVNQDGFDDVPSTSTMATVINEEEVNQDGFDHEPSTTLATEGTILPAASESKPISSCESITNEEQCKQHTASSSKCVWFTPLNWDPICFAKPQFPLKSCKEIRLSDDCLVNAVGCRWYFENKKGDDKKNEKEKEMMYDSCRFSRHERKRRYVGWR